MLALTKGIHDQMGSQENEFEPPLFEARVNRCRVVFKVSSPRDRGRARLARIHGAHQGGRVEVRSAASLCLG